MSTTPRPSFAETMRKGWLPTQQRARNGAGARKVVGAGKGARPMGASANGKAALPPELVKRREELAAKLAELQWDLGGMTYEMASRDHYRLDVLNKQASKLQEVDAELGQLELMLKLEDSGASGSCPGCGAMHARGAVFCWQCGRELKPTTGARAA